MKNRIIAVLLAVLVGIGCFSSSVPFLASAVGWGSVLDMLRSYFENIPAVKVIDSLSSYDTEFKYGLLVGFRDFCVNNDIDPNSQDFEDFVVFLFLEAPDDVTGQYSSKYGSNWSDLHSQLRKKYFGVLVNIYQMNWEDVVDWVRKHYDDSNTGFDDDNNVFIPGIEFALEVAKQNQTLTPKNPNTYRYSWRDLSNSQASYSSNYLGRMVGKNGQFLNGKSFAEGVYVQPYIIMGDVSYDNVNLKGEYYSPFHYYIYLEDTLGESFQGTDGSSYPNHTYTWKSVARYYLMEDGEPIYTYENDFLTYSSVYSSANNVYDAKYYPFATVSWGSGGVDLSLYSSQVDCYTKPTSRQTFGSVLKSVPSNSLLSQERYLYFKSDDISKSYNAGFFIKYFYDGVFTPNGMSTTLTKTLEDFNKLGLGDSISDYGLLFSSEPFTTTFLFDPVRFPEDCTITITGDTLYDYTITNNTTGDTTTIYNYYINNYEFPDDDDKDDDNDKDKDSDKNGSGSLSGDVNVGGNVKVDGKVDVGGKVDIGGNVGVDVNVNITGDLGGTVGGSGTGTSYDMPDMSPLDGYLDEALEQSSGIRSFLKTFFSFLPTEIVILLGIGLTVVILARIFGR